MSQIIPLNWIFSSTYIFRFYSSSRDMERTAESYKIWGSGEGDDLKVCILHILSTFKR